MRDILVDNSVAHAFANPVDPEYKRFIRWIVQKGVLVVTQRLIREYTASSAGCAANTSLPALVDHLTRHGRLAICGKAKLAEFKIRKHVRRRLRSNWQDHDSIKAVMLSNRKLALCKDQNLCHDINNYPGHRARAARKPGLLAYE